MRHVLRVLLVLTLAALPLFAQATDVQGYRGCRWGMSAESVKTALGGEVMTKAPKAPTPLGDVCLEGDVEIQSVKLSLKCYFDKDADRLCQIRLMRKGYDATESDFGALLTALTQKYGKPTLVNEGVGNRVSRSKTVSWIFPTTTIELDFTQGAMGLLHVAYSPTQVKSNDKL